MHAFSFSFPEEPVRSVFLKFAKEESAIQPAIRIGTVFKTGNLVGKKKHEIIASTGPVAIIGKR